MRIYTLGAVVALVFTSLASPVQAGRILVANDEWPLSNDAFVWPGTQSSAFTLNVASWFAPSGGNLHIWSTNFGLNSQPFQQTLLGAGYNVTFGAPALPLSAYDAVFVGGAGFTGTTQGLTDYVNAGGDVYILGGTGQFSAPSLSQPAAEAAFWNPFLNAFGLGFAPRYNGIVGPVSVAGSGHPVFSGVSALYQQDGSSILDLQPLNDDNRFLVQWTNADGLYAVYDPLVQAVPEPSSWLFASLGLLVLRRRRR